MSKPEAFSQRIKQAFSIIPKEHSSELRNEVVNAGMSRVAALSTLLIAMNLLMIFVDLTVYYPRWVINEGYIHLFYAHIFMVLERSSYLLIAHILRLKKSRYLYQNKKLLVLYSCFIGLIWCSYLSINAQNIHGQISAFIIGSFSIASAILLLPKQSLSIFTFNSAIFVIILYFTPMKHGNFASNAINTLFVLVFAFLMSYMNITLFTRDYINKKTIEAQARELESSRNRLEETVKVRTEELIRANEQLIREMGIRHQLEIQSMKTKLLYEENVMLLSEIKEYEELRNVFFANLSHELRTPLNVIFSAQQMMNLVISKESCGSCKNQISKYNRIVKQNCYRLIRLIGNLIDITKIDAKYFEISKKNCDIVALVEGIAQSVADYIKGKNLELVFDTDIEEKIIACDPDKVERIVLNLLSNAVKFTPPGGEIYIRVSVEKGSVVISVKDTGIGISKELQQVVFERFVQVDKSTSRNREGSGIGLSLVKSLVDLHQGSIALDSEQGRGSEFTVRLPDIATPFEDCVACTNTYEEKNIERINIEFSDIYS